MSDNPKKLRRILPDGSIRILPAERDIYEIWAAQEDERIRLAQVAFDTAVHRAVAREELRYLRRQPMSDTTGDGVYRWSDQFGWWKLYSTYK